MRFGFITDIHEDTSSLQLALKAMEKYRVDEIICLGDVAGFSVPFYQHYKYRNAHECLRLVRENCRYVIPGNHDLFAIKKIPDTSPIFPFPANWYAMDFYTRQKLANGKIWLYEENDLSALYTDEDVEFLSHLAEYKVINHNLGSLFLSHYIYPNVTGDLSIFYNEKDEFKEHLQWMKTQNAVYGFAGHAHPDGFLHVNEHKMLNSRSSKLIVSEGTSVTQLPSIAGNKGRKGFCIFDMNDKSLVFKKI